MNPRIRIIHRQWRRDGFSVRGEKAQRGLAWLARALGCSRQALYMILNGERRSADIEAELSRMFPELPPWPASTMEGAVPFGEWLSRTAPTRRRASSRR